MQSNCGNPRRFYEQPVMLSPTHIAGFVSKANIAECIIFCTHNLPWKFFYYNSTTQLCGCFPFANNSRLVRVTTTSSQSEPRMNGAFVYYMLDTNVISKYINVWNTYHRRHPCMYCICIIMIVICYPCK